MKSLKKASFLLLIAFYGCAPIPGLVNGAQRVPDQSCIGKTKQQVFWLYGSPLNWSKHVISGKAFETWTYSTTSNTFDFKDGIVTGCSQRGFYITSNGPDDVRSYKNPFETQK